MELNGLKMELLIKENNSKKRFIKLKIFELQKPNFTNCKLKRNKNNKLF